MTARPRLVLSTWTDLPWLVLIAFATMLPNLVWGPSASHSDAYNYIWVSQFAEALGQGELYPRWLPRSFEGLGSPTFFFYPPLALYPPALLDLAGLSTDRALTIGMTLWTLASGLSMWLWLRVAGGRAMLGAALYVAAPYHLTDVYTRGALAEHAAFVWLPLIALGIQALPDRRGTGLLAVSYAGLIMTHLPAALVATVFLILPLAVRRVVQDRATLVPGLAAGALSLGLSAIYLLPALTLQRHISAELLWSSYYQPRTWFLLADPQINGFYLSLLLAAFAATVIAASAAFHERAAHFWAVLTAVAAAAALGLIPFVWDIPPLEKVQFPWRLLCVVEFTAITALALAAPSRAVLGLALGFFILANGLVLQQSAKRLVLAAERPDQFANIERAMLDAPEYLPRGFPITVVSDIRRIVDLSPFRDLPMAITIEVVEAGPVTLRKAAFPIWRVIRDGEEVPIRGPLLTFDAAPGTYQVVRATLWQEWIGALVSLVAALLLTTLAWTAKPRGQPVEG